MKINKSLVALALATALPMAAHAADGISYNYVQAGYTQLNGDDDVKAKGWSIDGSLAIAPNWSIYTGTDQLSIKGVSADANTWRLGGSFNTAVAANTDFIVRGGYQRLAVGAETRNLTIRNGTHFNGYNIETGVRSALAPQFEGYALVGYERFSEKNGFDPGDGAYGRLGGQFKITPNWGINGDVKFASGDSVWTIGPRYSW
ncbi:MAG: diffusible signal factor-reguated Ax21 family protein [Pseudomonadota bacterium]|nr:diffusible signal factor-reguated Ax21 family protein [Pseudomonadota bacterium]